MSLVDRSELCGNHPGDLATSSWQSDAARSEAATRDAMFCTHHVKTLIVGLIAAECFLVACIPREALSRWGFRSKGHPCPARAVEYI